MARKKKVLSSEARLHARVRKAKAFLRDADLSFIGDTARHGALVEVIEQVGAALGMHRFNYVRQ